MSVNCAMPRCVALATKDSVYCAVHKWRQRMDDLMGFWTQGRLVPVDTGRIEREQKKG